LVEDRPKLLLVHEAKFQVAQLLKSLIHILAISRSSSLGLMGMEMELEKLSELKYDNVLAFGLCSHRMMPLKNKKNN
jgi:hypothetical protein